MFVKTKYLLILFPALFISACFNDGGAGTTQKSTDVSYTNISVLGVAVNDPAAADSSPEISSNGLELFFHSNRATDSSGGFDLWVSTRASEMDAWGAATNLGATVNSALNDKGPDLSDDGLTLIFASDRPGTGNFDLYVMTRPTLIGAWSAPTEVVGLINLTSRESGPSLSSDGLSLYFHSDAPGYVGNTDLFVSTRPSIADPWESPVNLGAPINSTGNDSSPEISSDGLTLYFHSTRIDDGLGPENIWRITRTRVNNPWGTPTVVPAPVDSVNNDTSPGLSDDWQTLYFSSTSSGIKDIFQAVP